MQDIYNSLEQGSEFVYLQKDLNAVKLQYMAGKTPP